MGLIDVACVVAVVSSHELEHPLPPDKPNRPFVAPCRLRFHLCVEFGGETRPDAGAVEQVNALLAQVSEEVKLS